MKTWIIVAAAVVFFPFAAPAASSKTATPSPDIAVNRGIVELEVGGSAGISVRIAEDLSRLVNDGATRRLLPVVGAGALQNIVDLKHLRGIDMAILQTDVLDYARGQNLVPGVET